MTEVKKFFMDSFHHLGSSRGIPVIDVRFYPYAGLRHTIRLRSGQVYVRLSDICRDSPPEVLRALAFVLVARLLGKKIPAVHERTYREYSLTPDVMQRLTEGFVDELAGLHNVDVGAAGLADIGKPEGYVQRQVDGWLGRYDTHVATLAMDVVWYRRYRAGGGNKRFEQWERSTDAVGRGRHDSLLR